MPTPPSSLHPCPRRDLQRIPCHRADLEGRRKWRCPRSLPFSQPAGAAGVKHARGASRKQSRSLPRIGWRARSRLAAPHEQPRCPGGPAAGVAALRAGQRAGARGACQKFLHPGSSTCFQPKSQVARRHSSRWKLLHGWSLCSHTNAESQRLRASPQPWHGYSTREDLPSRFTASLCQYSNKPGCNGRKKRSSCLPL